MQRTDKPLDWDDMHKPLAWDDMRAEIQALTQQPNKTYEEEQRLKVLRQTYEDKQKKERQAWKMQNKIDIQMAPPPPKKTHIMPDEQSIELLDTEISEKKKEERKPYSAQVAKANPSQQSPVIIISSDSESDSEDDIKIYTKEESIKLQERARQQAAEKARIQEKRIQAEPQYQARPQPKQDEPKPNAQMDNWSLLLKVAEVNKAEFEKKQAEEKQAEEKQEAVGSLPTKTNTQALAANRSQTGLVAHRFFPPLNPVLPPIQSVAFKLTAPKPTAPIKKTSLNPGWRKK
jgi:hypothetical protein